MKTADNPNLTAIDDPVNGSIPTRHSLLARIKDLGDDASWRDFFDTYSEFISNLARKAGLTDTEAQEVVQETVIGISRKIAGFKTGAEHGSFKAWLLQQTRWRIADQFRKRDKFTTQTDDAAGTAAVNRIPDPASLEFDIVLEAEWQNHVLRVAIERTKAKASTKQFQMFDLHVQQGLSAKETARTVRASVVAVYMASSRVRRLLRREMVCLERAKEQS
jgi:RNA polymerase sigma-70 factor (ECF subfamily)